MSALMRFKLGLAAIFTLATPSHVFAQQDLSEAPLYELVNTLQINDPVAGSGIEMVFQADKQPEGGLTGDVAARDMLLLCKTWATQVIAHVIAQAHVDPPKFLSVQVRSGGFVGTYAKRRFHTDGKQCFAKK